MKPRDARTSPLLEPPEVSTLMSDLGFLLVPGRPWGAGLAYLLVALRPRPTLSHFDPERVDYWASQDGHGVETCIDWQAASVSGPFSWGRVGVVDRLREANSFIAFGGTINVVRGTDLRVAIFASAAPILDLGGHSGPADPVAVAMAGFLARLRGAAGTPPISILASSATPNQLYAAFLGDELSRLGHSAMPDAATFALRALLTAEQARLRSESPIDTVAGEQLAKTMRSTIESEVPS